MKYDTTVKDLIWRGAPALLAQLTGVPVREFLRAEYAETRARRPDVVARLTDGRLHHLELQAAPEAAFPWRMLDYYGLIARGNGNEPVFQQVLALTDAAAIRLGAGINHSSLSYRYDVVDVATLDAAPLLASEYPDDTVLAILCRTTDIRERVRDILKRIADLPEGERDDAVVRLLVLSGLRKAEATVKEEVEKMSIQIDIDGNEYLKSVFVQGEAKGKAEGKAEGAAKMLLSLLQRRFGPVPDTYHQAVLSADADQLEAWGEAIFDAVSLEALLGVPKPH